jgi:hypothetical protein
LITFAFGRHCNAPLAAAASLLYGNGVDVSLRVGPLQ